MNKTNIFKKALAFLIVIMSAITLVACKSDDVKIPYGNLGDKAYLKSDSHTVTEKDLYTEMRFSSDDQLQELINEIIFKEELKEVDTFLNKYKNGFDNVDEKDETMKDDFVNHVNDAIFGNKDVDSLKEYEEKSINSIIYRYIDTIFFQGLTIDVNDLDLTEFTNHSNKLFAHYRLEIAQKTYARKQIADDIEDEDSIVYIDIEKDIDTYFRSQVKKRYPLSSINIRFTNKHEADEMLRHYNIKEKGSKWYLLPDPRTEVVEGDAFDFLVEALGEDKAIERNGNLNDTDHKLYYEKYNIDPARTSAEVKTEVRQDDDQVLRLFLKIYNEMYPFRKQIPAEIINDDDYTVEDLLEDTDFVNYDEDNKDNLGIFTKEYDDYVGSQTSFRSYIYDTLSTEEDKPRYTHSPRSHGDYYFLAYKLKDHNEDLLTQVDEDDEFILYKDEDNKTLHDYSIKYKEEIIEESLTNNYISQKAQERLNEATILIYDEFLLLSLNSGGKNEYEGPKKKDFDNNLVAKVNDTEITVSEFYEKLEKQIGATVAMDMAVRHLLLNSEYIDKISNEKKKEYRQNVENTLSQFGQDMFAQSGFPASMGRKNFLLLAFNSESIDQAVNKVYINGELEKLFTEDFEKHFGQEVYDVFTDYANKLRQQYFSITNSHLLIYIDSDEDDSPDKPEDFFQYLEDNNMEDKIDDYKALILELMREIHEEVTRYSNFENGMEAIVAQYKRATKIKPDLAEEPEEGQFEYSTENRWSKYKSEGLMIKFENLGSYNNTTNYPTSESGNLDEAFFNRIHDLYIKFAEREPADLGSNFPKQELDTKPTEFDEVLQSAFGWHLIVVTAAGEANSAKFTEKDDRKASSTDEFMIYENIEIKDRNDNSIFLNMYNNNDVVEGEEYDEHQITSNQVRVYIYEKNSTYGLESIPSKVKDALKNYLDPVLARYNESYMKMHLLAHYSKEHYTFENASSQAHLDKIIEINQRQFLHYLELYDEDNLFYEIYSNWFNDFKY